MRNIIEKLYEGDIRPIEEYWSIQEMDEIIDSALPNVTSSQKT